MASHVLVEVLNAPYQKTTIKTTPSMTIAEITRQACAALALGDPLRWQLSLGGLQHRRHAAPLQPSLSVRFAQIAPKSKLILAPASGSPAPRMASASASVSVSASVSASSSASASASTAALASTSHHAGAPASPTTAVAGSTASLAAATAPPLTPAAAPTPTTTTLTPAAAPGAGRPVTIAVQASDFPRLTVETTANATLWAVLRQAEAASDSAATRLNLTRREGYPPASSRGGGSGGQTLGGGNGSAPDAVADTSVRAESGGGGGGGGSVKRFFSKIANATHAPAATYMTPVCIVANREIGTVEALASTTLADVGFDGVGPGGRRGLLRVLHRYADQRLQLLQLL
ncbi:hypothetical protein CXG81DRAFT_27352 [Caulochytrium protostelioides]|uniref:TUG ubiquitin-like domain-containing protein n=1 Tax=Caulochytrium protostelioides TaxID=1555241 RepID=A0A4P9X4D2_9FUNG|nr:hypothetical protein CXG81DRAFT_27352 [Caulochytrium protostelioides]|eukprot:RKO99926.1 hypothetical protein CXG81DRAFT_27352 [Caulochytrium protostelioides]